ncbi:small GTP-binding protein domain [Allomyces macrogynus ATCC 38327]|uniref:Small GTP-binding protein domain n=1 Tax=Allomyces macrogynus (strain ATCC 38327) TaxID=578462 RepID=A0A0L0RZE7_ALLM3|nr:small GTP-binding protein domain [Allomyces macrogynus ATCC 38327]|eukprot:KNE55439.1 small GTP-binding protein domain [Allomyces macrogynus ATCC 38327]
MLSTPNSSQSGTRAPTLDARAGNITTLNGLDNKKVLVVGSARGGKTCLVNRLVADEYATDASGVTTYQQTLGAELSVKFFIESENRLSLSIWCLGGHPRYHSTNSQFFTDDTAVVLVTVDLLNSKSLDEAKLLFQKAKNACPTALIYLVGTKSDVVDKVVFPIGELARAAQEAGAVAYKTTSSKAGTGIRDLFDELCAKLRDM